MGGLQNPPIDTLKLDRQASDGLDGTSDSIAYRIGEAVRHVHSYCQAFETAAVPNGEVHVADRVGSGSGAFQIDAGNDTWGGWVQVLGSSDTTERYDLHRITVENTERNATYFIQIAFGDSGAAGLAAEDYTDIVVIPLSNQLDSSPLLIQTKAQEAGTKAWARCMCPGQDTATIDFYPALHAYEG